MGCITYIVVSTPRSATGWAAQALTAMGLRCGHETYYNLHLQQPENRNEGVWGDSSWLAVPFIKDLPAGTIVLHQIRNPWDTIASIVGMGWYAWDHSIFGPEYRMFAAEHMIGRMPGDPPRVFSEVRRAAHFWMVWHKMIELYAIARADLTYVRYQVESPVAAEAMYRAITGKEPDVALVTKAREVDRKYNSRDIVKPDVRSGKLQPQVVELANRYGYP